MGALDADFRVILFPYFILNDLSLLMVGACVVVWERPSAGSRLAFKYLQIRRLGVKRVGGSLSQNFRGTLFRELDVGNL